MGDEQIDTKWIHPEPEGLGPCDYLWGRISALGEIVQTKPHSLSRKFNRLELEPRIGREGIQRVGG